MSTAYEAIIGRLERGGWGPRPKGPGEHESRCPAHQGDRRNLSVREGTDGTVLLHCHHLGEHGERCSTAEIIAALGAEMKDLFPAKPGDGRSGTPRANGVKNGKPKAKAHPTAEAAIECYLRRLGKPTGRWDYPDGYSVFRFDPPGERKEYRPVYRDGDGWRAGDPPGKSLPLYRRDDLPANGRIYLLEGEKISDLAARLGLAATTTAHGSNSPQKTNLSPLAGREVVILPDVGPAGDGYSAKLVELLHTLAPRPAVKVVPLPGLESDGDDLEQWLAARPRWTPDELRAELERLADEAPVIAPAREAATVEPTRPTILITHELHEVVAEAVAALVPHVFQRGASLAQMIRNTNPPKGMDATEGAPQVVPIPTHRLLELMSRSAKWVRRDRSRGGNDVLVLTEPTEKFAKMVGERCDWPGVRPLTGIIEAPTLRPDGTILQAPGYDADTGLYFLPNARFPEVPDAPTKAMAQRAVARLIGLVSDFPFESDPHRYAWLACLLTDVARFGVNGPCPLFLIDSNVSGAGKTKLADVIAVIATGRPMPRSSYSQNDAEMAKSILSVLLGGFRFVLFDNLQTGDSLGGPALDRALTAVTINDRLLGASKMSGEIPVVTVFHATGNNLGLRGDALRRIVPIRLESPMDRPEERNDFAVKGDLLDHVRERRAGLVVDALTVVRAYVAAGRPAGDLTPMDFPAWSSLVRHAVYWTTGVDPCETRKGRIADDDATNELAALIQGWRALLGERDALSAAEAMQELEAAQPPQHAELRALVSEWSKDGKLPTARTIGSRLKKVRGKPSGGFALDCGLHHGVNRWFVRPVRTTTQGGSGVPGVSVSNPRTEPSIEGNPHIDVSRVDEKQSHLTHLIHPEGAADPDREVFEL